MTTIQDFSKRLNVESQAESQLLFQLQEISLLRLKKHANFALWQAWYNKLED